MDVKETKLLKACTFLLIALKQKYVEEFQEHIEEFEVAIIEEKERLMYEQRDSCDVQLNSLGKRRVELCQKIDTRKKEQEKKIRGRS